MQASKQAKKLTCMQASKKEQASRHANKQASKQQASMKACKQAGASKKTGT